MKPLDVTSDTALAVLRAFKTIALADGHFEARKRAFVAAYQKDAGLTVEAEAVESITPDDLAAIVTDPDLRKAVVQRMVIIALLDEEVHPREIELLRAFSKTLGVDEPAVGQMKLAASRSVGRLAFDLLRHFQTPIR